MKYVIELKISFTEVKSIYSTEKELALSSNKVIYVKAIIMYIYLLLCKDINRKSFIRDRCTTKPLMILNTIFSTVK